MNYLGVDYGLKHVGLAIASGPLAQPLASIETEKALTTVARLVEEHQINTIVVGLPDGPVRPEVEQFVHQLKHLNFNVVTSDETLSTQDAVKALLHTSATRRKTKEHSVSAAIILSSYLDSHSIA